jgi:hypothetical protein
MLNLIEFVEKARARTGVIVHPPNNAASSRVIDFPSELMKFYDACNGIYFYAEDIFRRGTGLYTLEIRSKQEVHYLDPAYAEWFCNGVDVKRKFLAFAKDPYGNCYCFDTEPTRYGEIYDVSYGEPPIRVGHSFAEFLARILDLDGEHPDWRTLENYEDESLYPCAEDSLELQIQRRKENAS